MTRKAVFTVRLSQASTQQAQIDYVTVDLTATAPDDYTAQRGTLTFLPGETEKQITVDVRDDRPGEQAQRFMTTLYRAQNCTIVDSDGIAIIPAGSTDGLGGPLILRGLMTNAFHNVEGRGGYFHHNSGTSEGQSIGIEGSLLASQVLATGNADEKAAAEWYKANGQTMLDAMGNGSLTGPMLRQQIPDDKNTITLLHWLFAARGDIPSQGINYAFRATRNGNQLYIPANVSGHKGAADVYRVWQIYPATSYLLYQSPYSPSYDSVHPVADTSITLDNDDWRLDGSTVIVTIPSGAPAGVTDWFIVYGYNNAGTIRQSEAEEAYPCWTKIDPGYSACAPDTFRWFEYAMTLAMEVDTRTGMAARWQKLRDAMRRTVVKGQAISDLREIIKPMPQFDAIPARGEPSGMFCYSNHPQATPPGPGAIGAGANAGWIGYNFWSRVGGSGGTVKPGEFTWTPANMGEAAAGRNFFNGAIRAEVPAAPSVCQVQIGRGINDSWRTATAYQEADQFMFVALSLSRRPNQALGERCYVFMSSTKYYDAATRWYADIGQDAALVPSTSPDKPSYVLIPRTAFRRKDGDNSVLPAGQRFENFGISMEMRDAYRLQIVAMRPVSGASEQWVRDNLAKAVHGSPMPFFPGAMPFAINADTVKQQFVGWNGSPFHGYQLPDLWWFLAADAEAVHPDLNPATNMPVPDKATGAILYPISLSANGVAKTKNALLAEQQLLFLKHAHDKWISDGGAAGPFAHTFVMNTPARISIGNPTPHTWVYTNDDPNTRWVGYQTRVVESLAKLAWLSRSAPAWGTARGLALDMAMSWIERINVVWPNLDGTIAGMPTDWDDPRKGAPQTLYEEPHAPALILRACLWLKLSGLLSSEQLATVEAVGGRCWTYIERRWRTGQSDAMRHTWANDNQEWFGFWQFEIIATISYLLKYPAGIPGNISTTTLRERLVQTKGWLENNVR